MKSVVVDLGLVVMVMALACSGNVSSGDRQATTLLPATPAREPIGPIRISSDGTTFVDTKGAPFFWLADTAWMIFSRLTKEDASVYLADRAAKGFTVIQAYMVPWQWYKGEEKNRYGHLPFFSNDMERPNPAYFDHVEWMIEEAARHGLIMAFGPAELGAAYEYYDDEGAAAYGTYLADRFKRTSNIIWMLCGDARPKSQIERRTSHGLRHSRHRSASRDLPCLRSA